jgi:hypothetical protein
LICHVNCLCIKELCGCNSGLEMAQWYAICNSDYAECDPGMGGKRAVMLKSTVGKMLLGLCCFAVIANLAVCCAGDGPVNGGDPLIIPPGTKTIEPTPSILNEVLTVLAAVVLPTLF